MLETRQRVPVAHRLTSIHQFETVRMRGQRTRLELELRAIADDMVGHLDRDELSLRDEGLLADTLDEAVAAAMPSVMEALDRELTPRIESLPVSTRLVLARARRRLEFGVD